MKAKLIILALAIVPMFAVAQKSIKVSETNDNIGGGSHNAMSVIIYEADEKLVEKEWKHQMKKMHAKVSHKGGEYFGDDAKLSSMGDNTFDIYAKVKKAGDGEVELIVAVDLGGAFMSSNAHGDQFKHIKKMVYEFAVETTKEAIRGQVKEAEKELHHREKDQEGLEKDNEKLHGNIEGWKKDIEKAEKDIEGNLKDQDGKKKEIEEQKKIVEEVKAKEKAVK